MSVVEDQVQQGVESLKSLDVVLHEQMCTGLVSNQEKLGAQQDVSLLQLNFKSVLVLVVVVFLRLPAGIGTYEVLRSYELLAAITLYLSHEIT